MKKFLETAIVVFMCIVSVLPIKTFASETSQIQCYDANFSEERIQQILELNPQKNSSARADDLILTYNIAIAKNSSNSSYIDMVAKMFCTGSVVKCGFKKIVLQKRPSTSSSWTNSLTFEDLYRDSFSHTLGKTFSVNKGYQYRVVCTFYAKKSLFVTQKIEISSNYITL